MKPTARWTSFGVSLLLATTSLVSSTYAQQPAPLVVPAPATVTAPPVAPTAAAPAPSASPTLLAPAPPAAWMSPPGGRPTFADWQGAPLAPFPMRKDTYTGHIALVDGAALFTLLAAAAGDSQELVYVSVATYFLGAPAVHLAHGRNATAGASFGLRTLGPLLSGGVIAGVSYVLFPPPEPSRDIVIEPAAIGFVVGAGLGLLAAPFLDATLLARKEWFNDLRLAPVASVTSKGSSFGLQGAF